MIPAKLELGDGTILALDAKGYLLDPERWNPCVAERMALLDALILTTDHWIILQIFRDYFLRFDIEPPMRALVRRVREQLGEEKGNSRYLYQLFPQGPVQQACRYAGLPRPLSCI
ncbi:MAG: TusE/DsrC/DsvC family sulfur relay protein [Lysobacterales bacterium]